MSCATCGYAYAVKAVDGSDWGCPNCKDVAVAERVQHSVALSLERYFQSDAKLRARVEELETRIKTPVYHKHEWCCGLEGIYCSGCPEKLSPEALNACGFFFAEGGPMRARLEEDFRRKQEECIKLEGELGAMRASRDGQEATIRDLRASLGDATVALDRMQRELAQLRRRT